MSDGDADIDDEDQERIDRISGKRNNRRSRRRSEEAADEEQQASQPEQEQQVQQMQQGQQAAQAGESTDQNHSTETQQAQQGPQATQEEQAERLPQAKLEPVTQRGHDTFYLSEEIRDELNRIYRRVALDVLEETGVDIDGHEVGGRNRYFRPLALLVGARQLESMSPSELRETLEDEDLIDDLPVAED